VRYAIFAPGHSFESFAKRLLLSVLWPLALFSDAGRRVCLMAFDLPKESNNA
jgi:hypothetical protein